VAVVFKVHTFRGSRVPTGDPGREFGHPRRTLRESSEPVREITVREIPTGEVDLLQWNLRTLKFGRYDRDMRACDGWSLFPPCCGRGAACEHLHWPNGDLQWPNGDYLDLRVLRPIPEAFAGMLQGSPSQRALQEIFKALLGPHYIPPPSVDSRGSSMRARMEPEHSHEHSHKHVHHADHHESDDEVSIYDEPPDSEEEASDSAEPEDSDHDSDLDSDPDHL